MSSPCVSPESQRDSVLQPMVATQALPWESFPPDKIPNSNGVAAPTPAFGNLISTVASARWVGWTMLQSGTVSTVSGPWPRQPTWGGNPPLQSQRITLRLPHRPVAERGCVPPGPAAARRRRTTQERCGAKSPSTSPVRGEIFVATPPQFRQADHHITQIWTTLASAPESIHAQVFTGESLLNWRSNNKSPEPTVQPTPKTAGTSGRVLGLPPWRRLAVGCIADWQSANATNGSHLTLGFCASATPPVANRRHSGLSVRATPLRGQRQDARRTTPS
jgi:hypothetical protein